MRFHTSSRKVVPMRVVTLLVVVATLLALTSCRKNCKCYAYDGTTVDFSKSDVEASGGSCPYMIYRYGMRYYSLCEWD